MDSAEHQHGASAARPRKAAPLPEGTASAQTPTLKTTPAAPQTPGEVASATSATSVSPSTSTTTTIPASIVPIKTNASTSTTKKRPLASIAAPTKGVLTSLGLVDTTNELKETATLVVVPPALKTKYDNENAAKPTAVKAKKTLKKKKKKKFSSILSGMMKPKKAVDIHAERLSLRKNLGGGNFSKVDKI